MTIAVNTRLLLKNKLEGIGWFTHETLKRIVLNHPEHQFIFIFDRPFDKSFIYAKNVLPLVVGPPTRHYTLWYFWFEWRIPKLLKKHKADLFLSQDGWLPLNTNVPCVNVIHDLNFEHYPEFIPYGFRKYYHYFFPRFARKASRIATVSEFTKSDIQKQYGISKEKIDVVYNGCNTQYAPIEESEKQKARDEYSDGAPYFLFIGLIHPRKNLHHLFQAFDIFKENDSKGIKLLVVGEKHWWKGIIEDSFTAMKHSKDVIFTGRLEPEALKRVLPSALALTYVPFFEGFGIPILEAFTCETAVITSNVTSMPEVASDAALLVDPNSAKDIAEAMKKMATNDALRNDLIQKGKRRAGFFSWDASVDKLWNCIEKVLKNA